MSRSTYLQVTQALSARVAHCETMAAKTGIAQWLVDADKAREALNDIMTEDWSEG